MKSVKGFTDIMDHIFNIEKGYVNNKSDRGGPTNMGITIKTLSAYRGRKVTAADVKALKKSEATAIYKKNFWNLMKLDLIKSPAVQLILMDMGVLRGPQTSVMTLQSMMNQQFKAKLAVDGKMGSFTANLVNAADEKVIILDLIQMYQASLTDITIRDHSQIKFLDGWMNRTHKLQDLATNSIVAREETTKVVSKLPQNSGADLPTPIVAVQPEPKKASTTDKQALADERMLASMKWCMGEIGQKEIAGKKHNPRIIYYHSFTTAKYTTDEVAWCSSFQCASLELSGLKSTKNAAAKSFLNWGKKLKEPRYGCIVVFTRKGGGHVARFVRKNKNGTLDVVGGNQSNKVSETSDNRKVLGYFWPTPSELKSV